MKAIGLSPAFIRAVALPGIFAGIAVLAGVASLLVRDVYAGIPPAVPVSLSATCESGTSSGACEASVVPLNPGRFRIATSVPASGVALQVAHESATTRARVLLARSAIPGRFFVAGGSGGAGLLDIGDVSTPALRYTFAIPPDAGDWNRIVFTPERSLQPTVIDEIGFFADERGLTRPALQPIRAMSPQVFYLRYVAIAALAICAGLVVAGYFAPGPQLNRFSPWLAAVLCLAIGILELGTTFSPYWGRDLRSFYASEWLPIGPDSNLTGGLYEGSRLVQGLGLTVRPGMVQWHRMPGYGLLCGLAAFMARTTDVIEIAAVVILLQVLLYAVATAVFVLAAQRLFPPWVAWLLGVLIAMLPKQLAYTQPDSIIVPIQLLVLAALVHYLAEERERHPTFRQFVWVNLAFASWFIMRNDVLPGWIVIAAVLSAGHWRRLTVPIVLVLAIAIPWGIYKQPYRHEFDLMPTNTGEVLLLGLCEVPGAFPHECTDVGYVDWARRAGHVDPATNRASLHAAAEVVRHWATYPVHFGFMLFSKARSAVTTESFPGFDTRFNRLYGDHGDTRLFIVLLSIMLAALAVNHQRRRTLFLGWAVFINMPLFFVTFASSGRFYAAAGVSLVAATVPLVCEPAFYRALARHPWRVTVVVACLAAFVAGGSRVERLVTTHDRLHYWTPFLDPERSTLKFTDR